MQELPNGNIYPFPSPEVAGDPASADRSGQATSSGVPASGLGGAHRAGGAVASQRRSEPQLLTQDDALDERSFRLLLKVDASHERVILYRMLLVVLGIGGLLLTREWLLELLSLS
jgi:hypothetical protein